nr:MAG TPA: hypothetical protein [Caudoviricetes sp.]
MARGRCTVKWKVSHGHRWTVEKGNRKMNIKSNRFSGGSTHYVVFPIK